MEFEITNGQEPGKQRAPRIKSRANADPKDFARRHAQACFIPDEEDEPPQQMG
jgi:hypothetical protein